jgi:hypothetical protein
MQTVAPVGSIAFTEATRKLCEGYFKLNALGVTKVKCVADPVAIYQVTGLDPCEPGRKSQQAVDRPDSSNGCMRRTRARLVRVLFRLCSAKDG